ncbi:MAG: xylulokinase [Nitrososphaerota archaeon]|nr:xylulokinase [Nitrososphaerota archaeon]
MSQYLVGVDLGTSACKTVVFSLDGRKISESTREYPILHPQPGWAEQKPSDWWKAAAETIRESLHRAKLKPEEIIALSVASQREAVVPIGKNGKELYNSIIWLDNRTRPQADRIRGMISEKKVLSITGVIIDPIFSASKILWLKENVRSIFEDTKCFLCAKDYIIYKLSGEFVTDYSMASRTMLFDIKNRKWSEEICSTIGIPVDKLPDAKESTEIVGEVSEEASAETTLRGGLPIVNGGGDRPCECLGAGVTEEGQVNIGTGTGSVLEVPIDSPKIDFKGRVNCCSHVIPDKWEYEIIVATTGASLRWFRDTFGQKEKEEARMTGRDPYDLLTEQASKVALGSDGLYFYPYLTGLFFPKFNEAARGAYLNISLSHQKPHFIRAILEGVAFHYLEALLILKDLKIKVNEVSMVGGEARSELWNQIKADILGIRIRIPEVEDAAALGAAILAGVGTEHYRDVKEATEKTVRIKRIYDPNPEKHGAYERIYRDYREAFKRVYEPLSPDS